MIKSTHPNLSYIFLANGPGQIGRSGWDSLLTFLYPAQVKVFPLKRHLKEDFGHWWESFFHRLFEDIYCMLITANHYFWSLIKKLQPDVSVKSPKNFFAAHMS